MKILSLLEAQFETNISTDSSENLHKSFADQHSSVDNQRYLGSGNFNTVYLKNNPHEVNKISSRINSTENNEGFEYFIHYIISNGLQDNPHFPRVYNIKTTTDAQQKKKIVSYDMEKLIPHNKLTDLNEINSLIQKYFECEPGVNYDQTNRESMISYMVRQLEGKIEYGASVPIKSEQLNSACNIIYKMTNRNIQADIKPANIMYRRTKYGLDIVFSDPIWIPEY